MKEGSIGWVGLHQGVLVEQREDVASVGVGGVEESQEEEHVQERRFVA